MSSGQRILIIDDVMSFSLLLQEYLEKAGYEADLAADAA